MARAKSHFDFDNNPSPDRLAKLLALRCQVYCKDLGYESSGGDQESDWFDTRSRHIGAFLKSSGAAAGCCRLVEGAQSPFPCEMAYNRLLVPDELRSGTAEVGRLAISGRYKRSAQLPMDPAERKLLPLLAPALYILIAKTAQERGYSRLLAFTSPALASKINAFGPFLKPLAEPVEHRGERAAYMIDLRRLRRNPAAFCALALAKAF